MSEAPEKNEDGSLDLEPNQLTEFDEQYNSQVSQLPDKIRIIIEKISWQIRHEGLTVEEACLITNVDADWLEKTMEKYPIIARIIAKKELQFKMKLTKPLINKAKQDDKMSMFLLEARFPQKKKRKGEEEDERDSGDMLAAAISHIQEHGDSAPLVNRSSGSAIVMAKGQSAKRVMEQIGKWLK